MDLKEVIRLMAIFCCLTYVVGNESLQPITRSKSLIPKTNLIAANSGESSELNGYNILDDFNFPDVTYPTSVLESCQPFYFNSNSHGLDAIVGPFSSEVKSNYRSLLSSNENKVKDTPTNKNVLKDDIVYSYSNVAENEACKTNKSEDTDVLNVVRKLLKQFVGKNDIDPELEEILSILYSTEEHQSEDLDHYLCNYNIDEKASKQMNEDIKLEENVSQAMNKDIEYNLSFNHSSIEENVPEQESEPSNKDIEDNEEVTELIILDETVPELIIKENNYDHLNLQNSNIDEKASDLNNEDINANLKINNFNIEDEISESINKDTDVNDKVPGPGDEVINHVSNLNNTNIDEKIPEPINKFVDVNVDEILPELTDSINKDKLIEKVDADDYLLDFINTDESIMTIPKESVVFDVVYKDGYSLEKPILDIVPSNVPVRLKINIEICKHDSSENDDLYAGEIDDELQTFKPVENDKDKDYFKNSIESIEEETVTEEQITELDEINESDFISALSILLLDSLNNKPIEIIPSEMVNNSNMNDETIYDLSLDNNQNSTNDFESQNERNEPIAVPEFIYDNLSEQDTEYTNLNVMKNYDTSPLIDVLMPKTANDNFQEANINSDDILNGLKIHSFKVDSKEYEDSSKVELTEISPLLSLLSTKDESTPKLIQEILATSKEYSSEITSTEILKEDSEEFEILKYPDSVETLPLVNVFQLKITEPSPTVKDVSRESVEDIDR